jgi:cytochrome P450
MPESTQSCPELFGPEFTRDPYPGYAWLRDHSPVHQLMLPPGVPAWLVTRYDDVKALLGDPRLSKDMERFLPGPALPSEHLRGVLTRNMLASDPPAHTRLRRLAAREFTARRVEILRARIAGLADGLLELLGDAGTADLMEAFAAPLPVMVICELLGVPQEDAATFRAWSTTASDGQSTGGPEFEAAIGALQEYVARLVDAKRANPGADLISGLVTASDDDRLSDEELIAMVFLLLLGGHETTVSLIGNAVFCLLTHPGQLKLLRAEPDRLPTAIEEVLRYETPATTASMRFASEDLRVRGVTIPAGGVVFLGLGSANHDTERNVRADQFDIDRGDISHIAFGHGIHSCIGAALARLEGQVALGALLARFADLRLTVPPHEITWRPGLHFRGPVTLPVSYRTQI